MFASKIDLPADVRSKMIALLNANLVEAIDLQLRCKQAHWNVKGPDFIQLHKLFDELYGVVEEFVDLLAERSATLGGSPDGRPGSVAKGSRLAEYPGDIRTGRAHLEALATSFAQFGKSARNAIDAASQANDADTTDLFTEVSRGTDKSLWFLEAHLQAEA